MSSLIRNEITKILKKKSIYIMLIVTLGFTILTNVIYKYAYSAIMNGSYYSEGYIKMLEEDIKKLNPQNPEEVDEYISYKSDIDTYNLLKQYDKNSWQYEVIQKYGANYISQINQYTYKNKDSESLENIKAEYNEFVKRLNSGDWRKFAEEELEIAKSSTINNKDDIIANEKVETSQVNEQIEVLEMRLKYNIEYGNNYKNRALSTYSNSKMEVLQYEQDSNNKTYSEKVSYQKAKANLEKSKYVIENDKDIFNDVDSRGILLNLFSEYELFIIITVVLIAGAIVSEEFNKGTIKLLLVRPYGRRKILFAKFIVVILTVLFIMIAIGIMQFIVGGIFFGFESLKVPAVEYNHSTGTLEEMSILKSMALTGIGKLPIYILIGTLAFALSTLFTNTAVAITISLLGYMASSMINQFAFYYNIAWLKYFVTPNWNFTQFLYGNLPNIEGLSIAFSAAICLIYFLIMIIPSFIVFKRKNIKNI